MTLDYGNYGTSPTMDNAGFISSTVFGCMSPQGSREDDLSRPQSASIALEQAKARDEALIYIYILYVYMYMYIYVYIYIQGSGFKVQGLGFEFQGLGQEAL